MKSAIVDLVSINRFVFEGTPIISQNSNDFCRELMGQASYPTQYRSIQRTDSTLIGCYDTKKRIRDHVKAANAALRFFGEEKRKKRHLFNPLMHISRILS